VTKWLKLGSCSFHSNVVQCLNSLPAKFDDEILGWGDFRSSSRRYISEMVRGRAQVTITNRKSYVGFRLQQKSVTLNDLECQFTALSFMLCVL